MAKINSTASYPATTPALADRIIGTDVSDTSNDAAGETAAFTFQAAMDLFEANMTVPASVTTALASYQLEPSEGAFVDGDKTKLDGIEAGADVTDTANVTAAGALMDSELTDLAGVKALDTSTLALLSANTFTGTQDFNGQQVEGALNKVVTSVTGTLTAADHSGNILKTSGNVTIPTTAGFTCILIAGGAHTVTFNATTSAAMATGDLMTIAVESSTVIHAVLTAAADKVSFT